MTIELEAAGLNRLDSITKIANLNPVFGLEGSSISEIVDKMVETGARMMPLLNKKRRVVGMLTSMDILDSFLRREDFSQSISKIMLRDVIFCGAEDSIESVLQRFKLSRRGGFPVVRKRELVGFVAEKDFIKHFSGTVFNIRVEEAMTPKPIFITPNFSILDSLKSIVNTRFRRLPVVEGKRLIGLVTSADLIKYINKNNYAFEVLDEGLERVMVREVFSISKERDLSEAVGLMKEKRVGGIPVTDKNKNLEGIITERDILEEIV